MSYNEIPATEMAKSIRSDGEDCVNVEVPAQPPVFNPESARALVNLFRAVLEKRRQQEGT